MDEPRKRHCWECLRRCLVCDFTEPACQRCITSGTICPGYSDVKPTKLRWLTPGKVRSRARRRRKSSAEGLRGDQRSETKTAAGLVRKHDFISRLDLDPDATALVEASQYFNTCIYEDLIPINQLGRNPRIFPVSDAHLRRATTSPAYLRFGMICMTINHRINRIRGAPQCKAMTEKFYQYRGIAISTLREQFDVEGAVTYDVAIVGVMTLLLVELQRGSLNWRRHMEGLQSIVTLRGGYRAIAVSQHLGPLLSSLFCLEVTQNTTCPASALANTATHVDAIEMILSRYGSALSPFQLCPPSLFVEIIKINNLRKRATDFSHSDTEGFSREGYEILDRVQSICIEQWAGSKPSSMDDWLLLGNSYQLAVTLYSISSLQGVLKQPRCQSLRLQCAAYGLRLREHLTLALRNPRVRTFVLWPLVVLGVEAVYGNVAMRSFVTNGLVELSRAVGTFAPLTAKRVLEVFWTSGRTDWDSCFDDPYAFTMQIAVDSSGVLREA